MSFPGVPVHHLGTREQAALRTIAREAIAARVAGQRPPALRQRDLPDALWRPGASFVTLRRHGDLRGCIGSLTPTRPLAVDVARNAEGAAFSDPRFPPLQAAETADLEIKISVLTAPEPLVVSSWQDLAGAVEPGRDGLVVEAPGHRGTFLPAVWDQLPRPEDYLHHLWIKAGLTPGAWPLGIAVSRYRAEEF